MAKRHMNPKVTKPSRDPQPQPSTEEQSGSAGRQTGGKGNDGTNTGQDRYGQSGFGGKDGETAGQTDYQKSGPDGGQQPDPKSNPGSGRADADETVKRKAPPI